MVYKKCEKIYTKVVKMILVCPQLKLQLTTQKKEVRLIKVLQRCTQVETKRATPREEAGKPETGKTVKKIFVGGLKDDMTNEVLQVSVDPCPVVNPSIIKYS